jgi:hypothetical protein
MTPKQQVKNFLKKLKNPYWTPYPTSKYLVKWQGNVAAFNIYYVLCGRPSSQAQGDINKNIKYWRCANAVVNIITPGGLIGDTVLVLPPSEFWLKVIKVNPVKFSGFVALSDWQRLMNEEAQDSSPAVIKSHFLTPG